MRGTKPEAATITGSSVEINTARVGADTRGEGLEVVDSVEHFLCSEEKVSTKAHGRGIQYNLIQIGMSRPIRVDHTNCLQVAIKTHSFQDYVLQLTRAQRTQYMRSFEPEEENMADNKGRLKVA
jgi:hypothetical protein